MEKTIDKANSIVSENEKFIANILHDIKSPLYSIKIGLQAHLENELLRDVFTTTVDTIEYIEKFLIDYSFKKGRFDNKITLCDIKKIIDKKIENYKYIFINKNIHIDLELSDDNFTIFSIEIFLGAIIGNIISNMAFHGSKNTNALIKISKKNDDIIIDFNNYYNDDSSNFSLGLSFCHKFAKLIKTDLRFIKTKDEVRVNLKIPSLKPNNLKHIIGI